MKETQFRAGLWLLATSLVTSALLASQPQRHIAHAAPLLTNTPTRTPTPANIGNFVWDDLDGDGRQDAGEPGLAGITVQLWNSAKTALIDSTVTNGSGAYTLVTAAPGDFRVRVVLPSLADQFSPKDQAAGDNLLDSDINQAGGDIGFTDIFNIASNVISITSVDAGIIKFRTPTPTRTPTPINIGNFVWHDLNANGVQDAGEPGLAGVTVQLWNSAKTQLIDTTTTNANGGYTVVAQVPGNYRIRVVLPWAGAFFAPQDLGGDDLKDSDINAGGGDLGFSDIFNIASNVISTTIYDAGIVNPIAPTPTATVGPFNVGDRVWHDVDGDGGQTNREPGLYNITVQLWNASKTTLFDTVVTDANGGYSLNAPAPGSYRIRVILPAGQPSAAFTLKDANCNGNFFTNDLCDSDIFPSGGDFGFSRIYTFTSSIAFNTIDAGLINIVPNATPTSTPTPPSTDTPTPTGTPVLTPIVDQHIHLPLVIKQ